MWATMKAILDHGLYPRPEATGLAKRLAHWVMDEFAPLLEKGLGGNS